MSDDGKPEAMTMAEWEEAGGTVQPVFGSRITAALHDEERERQEARDQVQRDILAELRTLNATLAPFAARFGPNGRGIFGR